MKKKALIAVFLFIIAATAATVLPVCLHGRNEAEAYRAMTAKGPPILEEVPTVNGTPPTVKRRNERERDQHRL